MKKFSAYHVKKNQFNQFAVLLALSICNLKGL